MKYFRKHPDVLIIANYPHVARRVRKGRQTTPEELSTIIVNTIAAALKKEKKILLLTDATEAKSRAGFITITAWDREKPFFLTELLHRLLYNFQTGTVAVLYHRELFDAYSTLLIIPILLTLLRISGKRTILVFLTTPTISPRPSVGRAFTYILRVTYRAILSLLSTGTVEPMTIRTLKERRTAGRVLTEKLFPSPLANLGLKNLLREE